jgi:hypothetical protein
MDGTLTGAQQHSDGFAGAAPAGVGQMLSAERLASSPVGVEDVGLGTVAAGGPLRAVDLNHPLALFEQMRGDPGAEAAGALDSPTRPAGITAVLADPGQHSLVAKGVGGDRDVTEFAAGRVDKPKGVGGPTGARRSAW